MSKITKFNEFYTIFNELSYSANSIESAIALAAKFISKKIGNELQEMPKIEMFMNSFNGKMQYGIRYIIKDTTNALRFNFNSQFKIISIDYWGKDNRKIPTLHIDTSIISLVTLLPKIVQRIQDEKIEDIVLDSSPIKDGDDIDFEHSHLDNISDIDVNEMKQIQLALNTTDKLITEAKLVVDGKTYKNSYFAAKDIMKGKDPSTWSYTTEEMESMGIKFSAIYRAAREMGLSLKAIVKKGVSEVQVNSDVAKGQKELDEKKYADPDVIFDDIEKLTIMIANGNAKALIVSGMGGIGKCVSASTLCNILYTSENQ